MKKGREKGKAEIQKRTGTERERRTKKGKGREGKERRGEEKKKSVEMAQK